MNPPQGLRNLKIKGITKDLFYFKSYWIKISFYFLGTLQRNLILYSYLFQLLSNENEKINKIQFSQLYLIKQVSELMYSLKYS